MAVFGNKTGLSLSDNISAMFTALNNKNLKDYAIAQKDFSNQLLEYKTKVTAFQSKIGDILQLATDGYNVQSELAELKMKGFQGNLNSLMAFAKTLGTVQTNMDKMNNTMMYHAAEIQARYAGIGAEYERANATIAGINDRNKHYGVVDNNEKIKNANEEKNQTRKLTDTENYQKFEEWFKKQELAAQGGIPGASLTIPHRSQSQGQ
jgi:hypothetical protein